MPIQLTQKDGGKLLVIHVTGLLVEADYKNLVAEFDRLVREHGKLRVLFDMTGLRGWNAGAMWEELKFDVKHFSDIDRLAILGDKEWQHGMAMFFKPFTKATTRYFHHTDGVAARRWLTEPS